VVLYHVTFLDSQISAGQRLFSMQMTGKFANRVMKHSALMSGNANPQSGYITQRYISMHYNFSMQKEG
jgi:hypothetical protein